jgi:hypothetical protein
LRTTQEAGELFHIALLERRGELDGEPVVASQDADGIARLADLGVTCDRKPAFPISRQLARLSSSSPRERCRERQNEGTARAADRVPLRNLQRCKLLFFYELNNEQLEPRSHPRYAD